MIYAILLATGIVIACNAIGWLLAWIADDFSKAPRFACLAYAFAVGVLASEVFSR